MELSTISWTNKTQEVNISTFDFIPHTITITRNGSLNVNDSGRIKISVFVSGSENTKVCELNFKYTYTPSSTNPLD